MSIFEALRLAFKGLVGNRLRSGLTMLGILIGVGAVILLVAVGNGTAQQVQQNIQGLGSNLLIVFPGSAQSGGVSSGFGSGATLSLADVTALNDPSAAPDIVNAIPYVTGRAQMTWGNQNWSTQLVGTWVQFTDVRSYDIASGAFFTQDDVTGSHRVVVIGQTVASSLFNGTDPVGQTVKINRVGFRVIGVFASKGASGASNQDDLVVTPVSSAFAYLLGNRGGGNVSQIYIQAASANAMNDATSEATQILLDKHKISDPAQADFRVLSQQDILNTASAVAGTLTLLLGAIAAISLVVGGIGIMNIMLVTVTERTREIGIRKAIGARHYDLLLQFLIESMFLSGVGGLLGIAVGAAASAEIPNLVSSLHPVVASSSVFLAFGVSVGIGLFFGIYPANRAASLNPVEALRYE
ncbi:MAG: ABC transporter permease [Candidatus Dormibacteria bacterium]